MSVPNMDADYCKYCDCYSNSGYEICDECHEKKLEELNSKWKKAIEEVAENRKCCFKDKRDRLEFQKDVFKKMEAKK